MKNQRKVRAVMIGGVLLLGLAVLFSGCSTARDPWEKAPGDKDAKRVLVSFTPLYCFAKNVAGNHAKVQTLVITQGPHDYSPGPQDPLMAMKANLMLVNGLGLDEWFSKVKTSSGNTKLPVVEVGEQIPKTLLLKDEDAEDEHAKGGHHHHGAEDPHIWLGIEPAIAMVHVIRDEFNKMDPEHKADYDRNAAAYVEELKKLHEYGKKQFAGRKNRWVIPMHDSMHYFARSFGLQATDSIQGQPGVPPDASRVKKLVEEAAEKKVQVVTVEPQYDKKNAENLKKQIEDRIKEPVYIVEFDPLETAPSRAELTPDLYIRQMKQNIDELVKKLP